MKKNLATLTIFLAPLAFLPGCGGEEEVDNTEYVEASGTVSVEGKKVSGEGYFLAFAPEKEGRSTTIQVNSDGTFKGQAPKGPCTVELDTTKKSAGHEEGGGGGGDDGAPAPEPTDILFQPLSNVNVGSQPLNLDFPKN